jgi:hypothetical protein
MIAALILSVGAHSVADLDEGVLFLQGRANDSVHLAITEDRQRGNKSDR